MDNRWQKQKENKKANYGYNGKRCLVIQNLFKDDDQQTSYTNTHTKV